MQYLLLVDVDKPSMSEFFIMVKLLEQWKTIPNYEGLYFVSDNGIVKNAKGNFIRIIHSKDGYLRVTLSKNNIQKCFAIHRLVAITFIPNPENKLQVNHKNGIKTDNCLENLEWCTPSENIMHAISTGLRVYKKGYHHIPTNAKLSEENVRTIRLEGRYSTYKEIAKRWNVSQRSICDIFNYVTWKNI